MGRLLYPRQCAMGDAGYNAAPPMEKKRQSLLFLTGLIALSIGLAIYFLDRDASTVSFLPDSQGQRNGESGVFGGPGSWLPSFVHTYAFLLMAAAVFVPLARHPLLPCFAWSAVETLFELGQHDPAAEGFAAVGRDVFDSLPVLDATKESLLSGTFDPGDLLAIALGGTAAYLTIRLAMRTVVRGSEAPDVPLAPAEE